MFLSMFKNLLVDMLTDAECRITVFLFLEIVFLYNMILFVQLVVHMVSLFQDPDT